jgi:hypothetical protein
VDESSIHLLNINSASSRVEITASHQLRSFFSAEQPFHALPKLPRDPQENSSAYLPATALDNGEVILTNTDPGGKLGLGHFEPAQLPDSMPNGLPIDIGSSAA